MSSNIADSLERAPPMAICSAPDHCADETRPRVELAAPKMPSAVMVAGLVAGRSSDHQCNKDGPAPMEMRRAWFAVLGPDPHTSASPAGVSQSASPAHESASAVRSDDRHCECSACFAAAISTCVPVGMMVAPVALYESRPIDRVCARTTLRALAPERTLPATLTHTSFRAILAVAVSQLQRVNQSKTRRA